MLNDFQKWVLGDIGEKDLSGAFFTTIVDKENDDEKLEIFLNF